MNDEELLETEYIVEEYQNDSYVDEFDELNVEEESQNKDSEFFDTFDEMKLKMSRYTSVEGKTRFFRSECEKKYEFSRTPVTFYREKDNTDFSGIVLKELDPTHFIFLVDDPSEPSKKKMKKFDISDISIYF